MTNVPDFTPKQCLKALASLGFVIDKSKGKGGHCKAKTPPHLQTAKSKRTFIIVPYHRKFKNRFFIVKELEALGIPIDEFIKHL